MIRRYQMKQVMTAVLLLAVASTSAISQSTNQRAQDTFCAGDAGDNLASPLPQAVISAVVISEEGKELRAASEKKHQKFDPVELLKGAKIQLGASGDAFYLVIGSQPNSGASDNWYWIVRQWGNKAEVLLWAAGKCLHVSKKRNLGYRDIEVTLPSAEKTVTEIYRYNGSEYKVWRHKSPLTEVPFVRR